MPQHALVLPPEHIHILFQHDLVLRQRTGFIGTEDIHFAEGLNRTETLDNRLLL